MKTSRSSSRSVRVLFAATALVIKPFGPVPELLKADKPWHGFTDDGPVLVMLRAERARAARCEARIRALGEDMVGRELGESLLAGFQAAASKEWSPWSKDEFEGIQGCDKQPCDVKLTDADVARMAASPKEGRPARYLELVAERLLRYQRTQERPRYEFPGDPVDPWKRFEELGLSVSLPRPATMKFELRRLDLAPGRVKALHQILDTRLAVAPDRQEAVLWRRDVYTDHYYDSWGEWADARCSDGAVTVVQAVLLELDLMKKTDLFSRIMRSKMRGAAEDNGADYLDRWFGRIERRARTGA